MKMIVYGSHLCPDTLYALNQLVEKGVDFDYLNISASMADLKAFLKVRDSSEEYKKVREEGRLGIPCFQFDDGSITLDLSVALSKK